MTLGDLILGLRLRDPNTPVSEGFGAGHSDRGDYCNAAFKPVANTTIGEMLAHAEALLGSTQEGYKGGSFVMHEYVGASIGEWGQCGELITKANFALWDAAKSEAVTRELVGDVHISRSPLARRAVASGMSKDTFILALLETVANLEDELAQVNNRVLRQGLCVKLNRRLGL